MSDDLAPAPVDTHRFFICSSDDVYALFQTGFDVAYGYPKGGTVTALAADALRTESGLPIVAVKHSQLNGEAVRLGASVFAAGGSPDDIAAAAAARQDVRQQIAAANEHNAAALAEWQRTAERDEEGNIIGEFGGELMEVPELPAIPPINDSIAALISAGVIIEGSRNDIYSPLSDM